MSWREELTTPATFRGVPFRTTRASVSVGRRNVVNQYPLRDDPYVDDLGRLAREFDVEGHVIGEDYIAQRDALIDALELGGPGELVHPRYGSRWVSVIGKAKISESHAEGGIARFTITFSEDSDNREPADEEDTTAEIEEAAEGLDDVAEADFLDSLDIAGPQMLTDLVAGGMSMNLGSLVSIGGLSSSLGGLGSMVSDLKGAGLGAIGSLMSGTGLSGLAGLTSLGGLGGLSGLAGMLPGVSALRDQVAGLLQSSPLAMVGALRGVCRGLAVDLRGGGDASAPAGAGSAAPAAALGALRQMGVADRSAFVTAAAVREEETVGSTSPVTTESKTVTNEIARATLNRSLVISAQARVLAVAITDEAVATATEATQWRDLVVEQIDTELEEADPPAATARAMSRLRAAIVRDVAARAELLQQRSTFTPIAVLPALVLAHRIYQDADRADELVARNAVPHPAFVPARPLEVLL